MKKMLALLTCLILLFNGHYVNSAPTINYYIGANDIKTVIYENSKYAVITNNHLLFKVDKIKKAVKSINKLGEDNIINFVLKYKSYLFMDMSSQDSNYQDHFIRIINTNNCDVVGTTNETALGLIGEYQVKGINQSENLVVSKNNEYIQINKNGEVSKCSTENDIKIISKGEKNSKKFASYEDMKNKYSTSEVLTSGSEQLSKFSALGHTITIVHSKNKKTNKEKIVGLLPNQFEGVSITVLDNGLVYMDGSNTTAKYFYFSDKNIRPEKFNTIEKFVYNNKTIEVYQDSIYMENKKVICASLIGSPVIKGSTLYYYNYDGNFVYYNKFDLKNQKGMTIKKYKV